MWFRIANEPKLARLFMFNQPYSTGVEHGFSQTNRVPKLLSFLVIFGHNISSWISSCGFAICLCFGWKLHVNAGPKHVLFL